MEKIDEGCHIIEGRIDEDGEIMARPDGEYGVFSGDEIMQYKDNKLPIIEHFLYTRDCSCISSKSGIGKSLLALQMCCNLSTGEPFLGVYKIESPKKVLYIQTEGDRAETIERWEMMSNAGIKLDKSNIVHINWDGLTLNTQKGFLDFVNLLKQTPNGMMFDVIIIDPLYTTVKGSLSNDDIATDWVRNVRQIRRLYNCAFLVLHHEGHDSYTQDGSIINKGLSRVFGSVFWSSFFNQNFKLEEHLDEKGRRYLQLKRGKCRNNKIVDLIELNVESMDDKLALTMKAELSESNTNRVYNELLNNVEPLSIKALVLRLPIVERTIYRCIQRLMKQELVREISGGRWGKQYCATSAVNTSVNTKINVDKKF